MIECIWLRAMVALLAEGAAVGAPCRCALGQYELGVAYMVIAASQRDPGEYMLQLQRLAGAGSVDRQRYEVDAHLGRWPRALGHLMAGGRFQEALQLAQEKVSPPRLPEPD